MRTYKEIVKNYILIYKKNEKNKAGYVGVGMYDISISDGGSCKCRK